MGKNSRVRHERMEHLIQWRVVLGLSRQQVVNKIATLLPEGIAPDQGTLAKWEKGENAVKVEDLALLAKVYGVPTEYLFFSPGDRNGPEMMRRAYEVLTTKTPDAVTKWLDLGTTLPDRPEQG